MYYFASHRCAWDRHNILGPKMRFRGRNMLCQTHNCDMQVNVLHKGIAAMLALDHLHVMNTALQMNDIYGIVTVICVPGSRQYSD